MHDNLYALLIFVCSVLLHASLMSVTVNYEHQKLVKITVGTARAKEKENESVSLQETLSCRVFSPESSSMYTTETQSESPPSLRSLQHINSHRLNPFALSLITDIM